MIRQTKQEVDSKNFISFNTKQKFPKKNLYRKTRVKLIHNFDLHVYYHKALMISLCAFDRPVIFLLVPVIGFSPI